jgi:hypothetical protein
MVFARIKMNNQAAIPIIPYSFQCGWVGFPLPKNQAGICDALRNKAPAIKRITKIDVDIPLL